MNVLTVAEFDEWLASFKRYAGKAMPELISEAQNIYLQRIDDVRTSEEDHLRRVDNQKRRLEATRILEMIESGNSSKPLESKDEVLACYPDLANALKNGWIHENDIIGAITKQKSILMNKIHRILETTGFIDIEAINIVSKLEPLTSSVLNVHASQAGIRAGRAVEELCIFPEYIKAFEEEDGNKMQMYSNILGLLSGIPGSMMQEAISLYTEPNGTLAHYRHNAASPDTFTGHGAFLRIKENGGYSMFHISNDRVTFGKRNKEVELSSVKQVLDYIEFLRSNNWYSSFLSRHARNIGLNDLPYIADDSFVSWRDRAIKGDI